MRIPPPEAASEYIANAIAWIDAATDDVDAKARWIDEKSFRNRANVMGEDREALWDRLRRKFPSLTLS